MKNMHAHIIGGTGSMGNWLKNFLEGNDIAVTVSGSKGEEDKILRKADMVFISVPISKAVEIIKETTKKVSDDCLLVDMSSINSQTSKAIEETGNSGIALHLLFGPTVASIQNQKVILCRIKESTHIVFLKKILEDSGAQVIELTPEEHDLQMANIQNLTHFANLSLAKVLIKNKISLTGKISTPVFLAQLSTLSRVISQSPELLTEIQLGNPLANQVLDNYMEYQKKIVDAIKEKDEEALRKEFSQIHHAIESATKVHEKIVHDKTSIEGMLPNEKLQLAFLGPEGTFSHQAAQRIINHSEQSLIVCKNIYEIFEKVANDEVSYGIVPAENSTEGMVRETLDYLIDFDLRTSFAVDLVIHQTLMSKEKSLQDIKRVISHPQAIAQSREWLRSNLPAVKIETAASTIAAAQDETLTNVAVIGSILGAQTYGLNVLAENIEDNSQNVTRFYVISKEKNLLHVEKTKTLLFLTIFNRVGILRDILGVFADADINLTKLESRPSREKVWDYHFFIEVDCNQQDTRLVQSLNILKQFCPVIKVLGGV